MNPNCKPSQIIYEIQVQGELDPSWQTFFNGLVIRLGHDVGPSPTTTLISSVTDQAALRGLLCKLWDLNLTVISVRQLEADRKKEEKNG
jgi:hypothetical protein